MTDKPERDKRQEPHRIHSYGNTIYFCNEKLEKDGGNHCHKQWDCYVALLGASESVGRIASAHQADMRDRDWLWCRALIATNDVELIARVTKKFNELRPIHDAVRKITNADQA